MSECFGEDEKGYQKIDGSLANEGKEEEVAKTVEWIGKQAPKSAHDDGEYDSEDWLTSIDSTSHLIAPSRSLLRT